MAQAPKPPKEHFIIGSRLHALALAEYEDTSEMDTSSANATKFRTRVEGRLVTVLIIEVHQVILQIEADEDDEDDDDDDPVYDEE